tara:strand:- start:39585 stop:39965 length:381 start_codon:yes stop_codon:yes gene_type:complete
MSEIEKFKFTRSHEWVCLNEDGSATVGISDFAQSALGDIVFVELPALDAALQANEVVAVVESVKAASDIYSPVSGTISAVNEALADSPETLNEEPYTGGWLYKITLADPSELDALLSHSDYQDLYQ